MNKAKTLRRIADMLHKVNCLQQEVVDGDRCLELHHTLEDLADEFNEMAEQEESPKMSKAITKQVREIVKKHYEYWATYNDIRKDKKTRRIKFMCNGYHFTADAYKGMAAAIKADLDAAGIKYKDEGFKSGESYRGDYVYYSVVLPA